MSGDPLRGAGDGGHPLSQEGAAAQTGLEEVQNKLSGLRAASAGSYGCNDSDGALSPLGSDCSDGPRRLVADPDSPTSRLLERAARRHEQAKVGTPEKGRFSFARDILRNPELARAARAALSSSPLTAGGGGGDAGGSGAAAGGGGGGAVQPLHMGAEVESLTAVVDQLDRDAAEESRINQQMSAVLLGRLQSGRAAGERALGVLQAFAAAEAAYARAMNSVSKLSLCGEADGPSLRAAMERASELPLLMGTAHGSVAERLGEAIRSLQALAADLRSACEEVVGGAARAQREVDASRHGLRAALRAHREAVQAFEAAAAQRARPGGRGRAVDSDPWLTEGCLVEQQVRLQRAQHVERAFLAKAYQRVGDLERRRAGAQAQALSRFVHIYRSAVVPIQQVADELSEVLGAVDAEADLEAFSEVAASSVRSAEALSLRQREAADQICSELLGSGEILRQGTMERWDSSVSKWQRGHLVLTRAGFLHFFPPESAAAKAAVASGMGGAASGGGASATSRSSSAGQLSWGGAGSWAAPLESLALSRCSFEQGEAPVFRIIEGGGGGLSGLFMGRARTQTLKAPDVDACLEWAATIREAIASCSDR